MVLQTRGNAGSVVDKASTAALEVGKAEHTVHDPIVNMLARRHP